MSLSRSFLFSFAHSLVIESRAIECGKVCCFTDLEDFTNKSLTAAKFLSFSTPNTVASPQMRTINKPKNLHGAAILRNEKSIASTTEHS